uniref:GyrI-like domain-containing protein n=1 Tax=Aurantibacter sp. TaxID=2807103 RepID=UPI0035C83DDC
NNKTMELFKRFMPLKKTIPNTLNTDVFALQVYKKFTDLKDISPDTIFKKHALVEVSNFENTPEQMEHFNLETGLYAVFIHKGTTQQFYNTWHSIFTEWLPNSKYQLDQRPHFEVLPEGYNPNSEENIEEVWIPIKSN